MLGPFFSLHVVSLLKQATISYYYSTVFPVHYVYIEKSSSMTRARKREKKQRRQSKKKQRHVRHAMPSIAL
jgi:hypothetical protein